MSYNRDGSQTLDRSTHPRRGTSGNYVGAYTPPRLIAPVLGGYGLGSDEVKARMAEAKAAAVARFGNKAAQSKAAASRRASAIDFRPKSKVPVTVDRAGKVVVPTSSFWADWNRAAAQLLLPVAPAVIAALGPAGRRMTTAPLDALMDMFDPIEDRFGRAIDRVLAKKGNIQNYFGTRKNIKRVQSVDLKADASTRNLLRRLRTIEAFFVLFFTQPIDLAIEMLKEGFNITVDAAEAASKAVDETAKAAGKAVGDALKAGQDAAAEAASWFGLGSFGVLGAYGIQGLGAAPAAAAPAAAAPPAGAGIIEIVSLIVGSITALLGGATGLILALKDDDAEKPGAAFVAPGASDQGGGASAQGGGASAQGGGASAQGGGAPPVEKPGISPIVLVGGAALLAVLLLRK